MSLIEIFSSGNPGNPNKKIEVTATDRATQGGNPGNLGNPAKQTFKVKILTWLSAIGETDQSIIDETIDRCKADRDTLSYFLQMANGGAL